ncbi:PII-like signaling protein [Kitasatospora sp. GP30]|uniref:DUF190 domain-containing protein n=1 Tax=Kitasatospora sp. GP30 TaxID=3035084 RepID=UPI000C700E4C|nr:DUF190 domain-containing protein [Kitasatospora sp. GP30]MDH6141629.1 PII-like signaling protein [Kitasatospora sp. GP30]
MRWGGPALRLTVLVGDTDLWHHRPLAGEIVRRARAAGLAGASVFHGVEGYGAGRAVHSAGLLSISDGLPVAVVIVDRAERVRAFLPRLDELLGSRGLVTVEEVHVYGGPEADG